MVVSNVGSQMQIVGQGWLVRDLSAAPVALGLVSLASAVPMVFLTPIGGGIADHFPRRRLLACTQTGMLLQALKGVPDRPGAARSLRGIDFVMLTSMASFCALVLIFSLTRSFGLQLGWLLLVGIASTVFTARGSTLLQLHSPRELRGRVMSLATVANIGMSQVGGMLSAATATLIGAPLAVGGAALAALLVAGLIGLSRGGWRTQAVNLQVAPVDA
jgi:MFS family permease